MYDIEKASNALARQISSILKFDEDFEEVLAYGAFTILQTLWSILLILIGGVIFGVPLETLIASFAASILRKYSGGIHAGTPNRCAVIGTIIFVSLGIFVSHLVSMGLFVSLFYSSIGFLFAYYFVYRKAPKDTPSKPITEDGARKHLRRKALEVMLILLFVKITLLFVYLKEIYSAGLHILLSIASGVIWQSITLTPFGGLIISNLDNLLGGITFQREVKRDE